MIGETRACHWEFRNALSLPRSANFVWAQFSVGAKSCSGKAIAHQFAQAHVPFRRPVSIEGDGVLPEQHHDRRRSTIRVSFLPFLGISPVRYRGVFQKGKRRKDRIALRWMAGEPRPLIGVPLPLASRLAELARARSSQTSATFAGRLSKSSQKVFKLRGSGARSVQSNREHSDSRLCSSAQAVPKHLSSASSHGAT